MNHAIYAAVHAVFGVSKTRLGGRQRCARVATARMAVYWLSRSAPERPSWGRIAKAMGRDHSTVISGHRRISGLIEHCAEVREKVFEAQKRLGYSVRPDCDQFVFRWYDGRPADLLPKFRTSQDKCGLCRKIRAFHDEEARVAA